MRCSSLAGVWVGMTQPPMLGTGGASGGEGSREAPMKVMVQYRGQGDTGRGVGGVASCVQMVSQMVICK